MYQTGAAVTIGMYGSQSAIYEFNWPVSLKVFSRGHEQERRAFDLALDTRQQTAVLNLELRSWHIY